MWPRGLEPRVTWPRTLLGVTPRHLTKIPDYGFLSLVATPRIQIGSRRRELIFKFAITREISRCSLSVM